MRRMSSIKYRTHFLFLNNLCIFHKNLENICRKCYPTRWKNKKYNFGKAEETL